MGVVNYNGDIPVSQIPASSLQQISIQYFINKGEQNENNEEAINNFTVNISDEYYGRLYL